MPTLSIITINFNNASGLKKTIQSVLNQSYTEHEYIVIDGASTDGSKEVIQKQESKITSWISEPDRGIYHAMNKGILLAQGEYLLFLNSGDIFLKETILQEAIQYLDGTPIVYGDGMFEMNSGETQLFTSPYPLTLDYFATSSICHPSSFIKKDLFERYGKYNEDNRIVSDWEFFLKTIMASDVGYKKIDLIVAMMHADGVSRQQENIPLVRQEVESALKRYFPKSVLSLLQDHQQLKRELQSSRQTKMPMRARWSDLNYFKNLLRKICY